jgi:uncharacterized OB-fold protein
MATNSYLFDCEHCGSWVKVRPVCPKCGKEHSAEWLEKNEKDAKIADMIAVPFLVILILCWYFNG